MVERHLLFKDKFVAFTMIFPLETFSPMMTVRELLVVVVLSEEDRHPIVIVD